MDAQHIALDVIREVGPKGEFISSEHTMQFFKQEHWRYQAATARPSNPGSSRAAGAGARWPPVRPSKFLTPTPEPLPEQVQKTLAILRREAEAAL